MKESLNLKSIRKKLWLATGIVGIIQYTGLVASIVTKEKRTILISDASDNRICARINVLLQKQCVLFMP